MKLAAYASTTAARGTGVGRRTIRRLLAPALLLAMVAAGLPSATAAATGVSPAWVPADGGQYQSTIFTLARDPNLPAIRYAGGIHGFFRTLNGGSTWRMSNTGLPPLCEVTAILPLREHPATLLAGCAGADYANGLYQSDDRGLLWYPAGAGILEETPINWLAEGGGHSTVLLAATDTGIYRSLDGVHWKLSLHGVAGVLQISTLARDAFSPLTFYAGTSAGAYKSLDAGAFWFPINNNLTGAGPISQIAADPTRQGRVFLGTNNNGIYISNDGGNSWTAVESGPTHVYSLAVQSLAVVPGYELTPDLKAYLASQRALAHKKLKKGQKRPLPELAVLFAGTDTGIQTSLDGGTSWSDRTADANQAVPATKTPYHDLPNNTAVLALMGFGRSNELVAAGSGRGIYRSRDLARSWAATGRGLPQDMSITSVAVDPSAPGTAYLGTIGGGVLRLTDSGASMGSPIDGLPPFATVNDLLLQPARQGRLVAALGAPSGGVAVLKNGAVWALQSSGLNGRFVNVVLADPHDPDTLYAGLAEGGVGWSSNAGATWKRMTVGLPPEASVLSLAVDTHDSLTILAGTDQGLFATSDQGDTWRMAGKGLPPGVAAALLADPAHRGWFLAGTASGIFRSWDAGSTWRQVTGLLDGLSVTKLARDSLTPGTLLAATSDGAYRSVDNGTTWVTLRHGIPFAGPVTAVATAGSVAYAGTNYGPFFLSPTGPVPASGGQYFAAVGHGIQQPFLTFWQTHGGLAVFGYPRTEQLREGNVLVQYFERARLEYHPGIHGVVLTPLGTAFTKGRSFGVVGKFKNGPLRLYVQQTRHSLAEPFLSFWRKHGGAAVFGFPISEITDEQNGDGTNRSYVMQYFQNARLEYHPESKDAGRTVQLGLLGDQLLQQRGWLQY